MSSSVPNVVHCLLASRHATLPDAPPDSSVLRLFSTFTHSSTDMEPTPKISLDLSRDARITVRRYGKGAAGSGWYMQRTKTPNPSKRFALRLDIGLISLAPISKEELTRHQTPRKIWERTAAYIPRNRLGTPYFISTLRRGILHDTFFPPSTFASENIKRIGIGPSISSIGPVKIRPLLAKSRS